MRDRRESELPPIGLVELEDAETGERLVVDTSNRDFRAAFASRGEEARAAQDRTFRRSKVDVVDLGPGRPYLRPLMRFFEERGRRI